MKIKLKQTQGFFLKTHLPYLSQKKKDVHPHLSHTQLQTSAQQF